MKLKPDHPQFDITLDLEVGDTVEMSDTRKGIAKKAHAKIVAVVREEDDPYKCLPVGLKPPSYGYGSIPRETRSYLVQLPRSRIAYWPKAKGLKPVVTP